MKPGQKCSLMEPGHHSLVGTGFHVLADPDGKNIHNPTVPMVE